MAAELLPSVCVRNITAPRRQRGEDGIETLHYVFLAADQHAVLFQSRLCDLSRLVCLMPGAGLAELVWQPDAASLTPVRSSPDGCRSRYFFLCSMSFMPPLPGLVAQTNMASSPHFEQTWFTSWFFPLPWPVPTTVTVPPQTHLCS